MKTTSKVLSKSYKPAVFCGFALQIFLLLFSSLILDGGAFLRITCVSALAFWTSVVLIVLRNPENPSKTDLEYIKYGPLLIAVLAHIIVYAVWQAKGII
jgi:ABC-type transport system involved in cytochrome c biogenesis permease subunit